MPRRKALIRESFEIRLSPPTTESYPVVEIAKLSTGPSRKAKALKEIDASTDPDVLAVQIGRMVLASSKTLSAWIDPPAKDAIECTKCGVRNTEGDALCRLCGWDLLSAYIDRAARALADELRELYPGYWGQESAQTKLDRAKILYEKAKDRLESVAVELTAKTAWLCRKCVTFNLPGHSACRECGHALGADEAAWKAGQVSLRLHDLTSYYLEGFTPHARLLSDEVDLEARMARKGLRKVHSRLFVESAQRDPDGRLSLYSPQRDDSQGDREIARIAKVMGKHFDEVGKYFAQDGFDAAAFFEAGMAADVERVRAPRMEGEETERK